MSAAKQDTVMMRLRYRPPSMLPALAQSDVLRSGASGAWTEPPGEPRRFIRYAPEFIDDPDETGLFQGLGSATYTSPPVFVTALDHATLFGYRMVAAEGSFCTDEAGGDPAEDAAFLDKLASPDSFANEETGLQRDGSDVFTLTKAGRPFRDLPGTVVSLCSHEPSNYGSFLFRVLSKLQTVETMGLQGLPVVAWAYAPAFQQLLALCGVHSARLVQHEPHTLTTFGRIIAPSLRNPHGFLDPSSHAFFQRLAARQPARSARRLYVSRMGQARRGGSSRVLANEAELASAMSSLGFEVLEPETLSPAEQIAAFASADAVVGPAGSAMFNTVFCRPGTKVLDIESEPDWIYSHTGLFASCKLRYGLFVGQVDATDLRPVHRRWTVNVPAVVSRVRYWV